MSLSISDAVRRCEQLMSMTQMIQTSNDKYQKDLVTSCSTAYDAIEQALKKEGVDNIDDLAKKVAAELPEDEAKHYLEALEKMKPTEGVVALLTGGHKQLLDIGIYLSKFIVSLFVFHYIAQIRKGRALESKAFEKIGQAYSRTIMQRAVAQEAAEAALQAANSHISSEEISNLMEKFKIGTAEEISVIEEEGGVALTAAETAANDALVATRGAMIEEELISGEAIAAARGLARAGIEGLIAAIVVYGALEIVSSFRASQQEQQLRQMIVQCATARLYCQTEELTTVGYVSLNESLVSIAEAYSERVQKPDMYQKKLDRFIEKAKGLVPSIDKVYADLFKTDAQSGAYLNADPPLAQMQHIHDEQVETSRRGAKKS